MTIFEIQKDLNDIYEALEANGGEVTEELADRLNITESNYSDKLEKYYNMIKMQQSELELIKSEVDKYKVYKKRVDTLKDKLSNVVTQSLKVFGTPTKSGGYEYKKPTFRFLVSPSATYDINKDLVAEVKCAFIDLVQECLSNDIELDTIDITSLVNLINTELNARRKLDAETNGYDYEPVTISESDLKFIKFSYTTEFSLLDVLSTYNASTTVGMEMFTQLDSLECTTSKSLAKELYNKVSDIAVRTVSDNIKVV